MLTSAVKQQLNSEDTYVMLIKRKFEKPKMNCQSYVDISVTSIQRCSVKFWKMFCFWYNSGPIGWTDLVFLFCFFFCFWEKKIMTYYVWAMTFWYIVFSSGIPSHFFKLYTLCTKLWDENKVYIFYFSQKIRLHTAFTFLSYFLSKICLNSVSSDLV